VTNAPAVDAAIVAATATVTAVIQQQEEEGSTEPEGKAVVPAVPINLTVVLLVIAAVICFLLDTEAEAPLLSNRSARDPNEILQAIFAVSACC
jgi:hypothetical protein